MVDNENQENLELNIFENDEVLNLLKEYVSNESCNVVFVATDKQIEAAHEDEELGECFKKADMIITSKNLKNDENDQENSETSIDVDMINQITEDEEIDKLSVMLMTDDASFAEVFESKINELFNDFDYVGNYVIEQEIDDDLVINEINGKIPDILVCSYISPLQENWIMEHKSKINVKMCVVLSGEREEIFQKKESGFKWIAKLLGRQSLFGMMIL